MSNELVPKLQPGINPLAQAAVAAKENILDAFGKQFDGETLKSYRQSLQKFAAHFNLDLDTMLKNFFDLSIDQANNIVLQFRMALEDKGFARGTIDKHLAAIKAVSKLARMLGRVSWTLDSFKNSEPRERSTQNVGPGLDKIAFVLGQLDHLKDTDAKAARDRAILWLFLTPSLRRHEVCQLNYEECAFDETGGIVKFRGKKRKKVEDYRIPLATAAAINDWVKHRGTAPGPLFVALDVVYAGKMKRLSKTGLSRIMRALGERYGIDLTPHKVRHTAGTVAFDEAELHEVQQFMRHSNPATTTIYDDKRSRGEAIADRIAAKVINDIAKSGLS